MARTENISPFTRTACVCLFDTCYNRVVARYVGIRDQRGGRDQGSQPAPGSGITSHGIGIRSFLRDHGSGYTIFVGSGTIICHAFGIKDQNFGYKNGISDEKTTSLRHCYKDLARNILFIL